MKYTVYITDNDYGSISTEIEILDSIADVVLLQKRTEEELVEVVKDADALIVEYATISRRLIEQNPDLKVIARYGVGIDSVDVEVATRNGVMVVNQPDYCLEEVSNHAVALVLSLNRKIVQLHRHVVQATWELEPLKPIFPLQGAMLGLLGFGNIARMVAEKLKVFGVELCVYDPFVADNLVCAHGGRKVTLDELLSISDIISVHIPHNKYTHHMLDASTLKKIKSTAILVNTSRGGIIDEQALYDVLCAGKLAGAALDVVEHEPIARDHVLLGAENVIITPHASFYSEASIKLLQQKTAQAVRDALQGNIPYNVINRQVCSSVE